MTSSSVKASSTEPFTGKFVTVSLAVSSVAFIGYKLAKSLSITPKVTPSTEDKTGALQRVKLDSSNASNECAVDLSPSQWQEFFENGFVKIGRTLSESELFSLQSRVRAIMLGEIDYKDALLMQLDPSYGDNASKYFENKTWSKGQTVGFKGKTLNYRKIGEAGSGLECDHLFHQFMKKSLFKKICQRVYGAHAQISVYRCLITSKPPAIKNINSSINGQVIPGGSSLPWHQDGGEHWGLDRDPKIFVWTALYPSNRESGCIRAIKGSHKLGLLSRAGHMLSQDDVEKYCKDEDKIVDMVCNPGETWLVHNWTIWSSGVNNTNVPNWGFHCNYTDGRTQVLDPKPKHAGPIGKPGQKFHVLWQGFE